MVEGCGDFVLIDHDADPLFCPTLGNIMRFQQKNEIKHYFIPYDTPSIVDDDMNTSLKKEDVIDALGNRVICVEGGIGVGKTTFVTNLYSHIESNYGIPVETIPECIDKCLLERFIENPNLFASLFQESMAYKRLFSACVAREKKSKDGVLLLDTGILREIAFVNANLKIGNLTKEYKDAHMKLFEMVHESLDSPSPDIVILLDCNGNKCLDNVMKRKRSNEDKYSVQYLQTICDEYRNGLDHHLMKKVPITIRLDVSEQHISDMAYILTKIVQEIKAHRP